MKTTNNIFDIAFFAEAFEDYFLKSGHVIS